VRPFYFERPFFLAQHPLSNVSARHSPVFFFMKTLARMSSRPFFLCPPGRPAARWAGRPGGRAASLLKNKKPPGRPLGRAAGRQGRKAKNKKRHSEGYKKKKRAALRPAFFFFA
jgi:hypothetical protein